MLTLTAIHHDYRFFYYFALLTGLLLLLFFYLLWRLWLRRLIKLTSKPAISIWQWLLLAGVVMLLPLVFTVLAVTLKRASFERPDISEVKITQIDEGLQLLDLSTAQEQMIYLQYRDVANSQGAIQTWRPILPTYPLGPVKDHSIIVDVAQGGGEARFVIDGQQYDLDGQALTIPYQQTDQ